MKQLLVVFLLVVAGSVSAQNVNHTGLFPVIDHSGILSDKWNYSLYFAALNLTSNIENEGLDNSRFFIFYSEQALSYKLNKNFSSIASYVYERQYPIDKSKYRNENRFYVQALAKSILGAQIRNRIRYDGRFIQDRITHESLLHIQHPVFNWGYNSFKL